MNKNRVLKVCACACVGAAIGFGIDMMIKKCKQKEVKEVKEAKEVKEVKEDKTLYVVTAVDTVVKIGCTVGAFYVFMKTIDYISEVDTKATVSNVLNFINGAKLGIVDEDTAKFALETALPTLDECSQRMLKEYANIALPDLLGGADHE